MLARHHNTSSYFLGELEAWGDIEVPALADIPGPRPVQSVAPRANLCFRAILNLEGRASWALGPSRCLPLTVFTHALRRLATGYLSTVVCACVAAREGGWVLGGRVDSMDVAMG